MTTAPTIWPVLTASSMAASSALARSHGDVGNGDAVAAQDAGLATAATSPPIEDAARRSRRDTSSEPDRPPRNGAGFNVDFQMLHSQRSAQLRPSLAESNRLPRQFSSCRELRRSQCSIAITGMQVFSRAANAGSLSAAARQLSMSRAWRPSTWTPWRRGWACACFIAARESQPHRAWSAISRALHATPARTGRSGGDDRVAAGGCNRPSATECAPVVRRPLRGALIPAFSENIPRSSSISA